MLKYRTWPALEHTKVPQLLRGLIVILALVMLSGILQTSTSAQQVTISFHASGLIGESSSNPTSLQFGPDGRLYVSQQNGTIYAYQIIRNDPTGLADDADYYEVVETEAINLVKLFIPDHDDDGTPINKNERQITGIYVTGSNTNPVLYVSSSDERIGAGSGGADVNLDTNSGVISRLTCVGGINSNGNCAEWDKVDLVRGLPRSEENHSVNGIQLNPEETVMYLAVGGHTNAGSPSNNFTLTTEYALSAAVLQIDLTMLEGMPIQVDNSLYNNHTYQWVYDLPTLDDPTRPNVNGIIDPDDEGYDGVDINDPFGGNDGLNQAKIVIGGPVQMFSPGWRNLYDIVLTENGRMYGVDNGANGGWGGHPALEADWPEDNNGVLDPADPDDDIPDRFKTTTPGLCTNEFIPGEPGSSGDSKGPGNDDQVNNKNGLHYIRTLEPDDYNYFPEGAGDLYYGGHPAPVRGNPVGAGLQTNNFFRSEILDPSEVSQEVFESQSLPVDWPPVPSELANPVECDFRQSGQDDGALANYGPSTNGITEYTASNFGGAMQGNLLVASFNENIYEIELSNDGKVATNCPAVFNNGTSTVPNCHGGSWGNQASFASNFGSNPLDVIAQGDLDVFSGTVWAVTYGANNITIFEPGDYDGADIPLCTGEDSDTIDEDGDGYTNADEIANGTDECSGASKPDDDDNVVEYPANDPVFKLSNLLDTDDDQDTIPDTVDAFALDGSNGMVYDLPLELELFNLTGYGFGSIGFTGLMSNGQDYLTLADFDADELIFGGTSGLFTVPFVTSGTASENTNNQENGFQFGVNVDTNTGPFVVTTPMESPFFANSPTSGQSQGLYIGTGDQSTYLKFAITADGVEVITEINDVVVEANSYDVPVDGWATTLSQVEEISLFLEVDPIALTVTPHYILVDNEVPGPLQTLTTVNLTSGTPLANVIQGTYTIESVPSKLAVGAIATTVQEQDNQGNFVDVPYEATWDYFYVLPAGAPTVANPIPHQAYNLGITPEAISLTSVFNDDFGTSGLTLEAESSNETVATVSINDDNLLLTIGEVGQAEITVTATDTNDQSTSDTFLVTVSDEPVVLYRVNAGGPAITSIDDGPAWEADEAATGSNANGTANPGTPSPFLDLSNGAKDTTYGVSANLDTTAIGVPSSLYNTERWSDGNGTDAPYMTWNFPVDVPGNYVVRLYFAEIWSGAQDPDVRVFDVNIEGQTLIDDFDATAAYGWQVSGYEEVIVNVTDGNIDIDFIKDAQNPAIKAIEILGNGGSVSTPIVLSAFDDQINTEGDSIDLAVSATGGEGNLSYEITGAPAGVEIEPTNGQIFGVIEAGAADSSPYTVTVTVDDSDDITEDAKTTTFQWTVSGPVVIAPGDVLYRINVGGPELPAADDTEPVWAVDTNNTPSPFRMSGSNNTYNGNSNSAHDGPIVMDAPLTAPAQSPPPSAPAQMFNTERFDLPVAPEMLWQIPVDAGVEVEVRLYFAELFGQANAVDFRVFDVSVDGTVPAVFTGIDPYAIAGPKGAFMLSHTLVSDGMIDLTFIHGIENPALKGIEIVALDTDVAKEITIISPADGEVIVGDSITLEWTSVGGGMSDAGMEHIHVQLNDEDYVGSQPFNGSYTFENLTPGPYTLEVVMADGAHAEYAETLTTVDVTLVAPVVNDPPVIAPLNDLTLAEGQTQDLMITVTDEDEVTDDTITVDVAVMNDSDGTSALNSFVFNVQTSTLNLTPQTGSAGSYTATITADDGVNDPVTASFALTVLGEGTTEDTIVYRINNGGGLVDSVDSGPDWAPDTKDNPFEFLMLADCLANHSNPGQCSTTYSPGNGYVIGTNDTGAPNGIFNNERYVHQNLYQMLWAFPVDEGDYVVNLYFAENWTNYVNGGPRNFDLFIEGTQLLDEFEIYEEAGGLNIAIVKSFTITDVTDGTLNIDFVSSIENAKVNGIEIIQLGSDAPLEKTVSIIAPTNGATLFGDSLTLEWTSTGGGMGDAGMDHIHVQINDEPYVGAQPFNGSYIFEQLDPGQYTLEVAMADGSHTEYSGVVDTIQVSLEAIPVNDPPIITPIADQVVTEGDLIDLNIAATDVDDFADTITLDLAMTDNTDQSTVPDTVYDFTDNGDGTADFTWTTVDGQDGSYTATITATDGVNDPVNSQFNITINNFVLNIPPVIVPIADQVIIEEDTATVNIVVNDFDDVDEDTITVGVTITDDADGTTPLDTFSYDTDTQELTIAPALATAGSYTATVTANDGFNDAQPVIFAVTVIEEGAVLLSVDKQAPESVLFGEQMTYTIDITNDGTIAATNVTVSDTLPAGATFASATPPEAACADSDGTVTCSIASLAAQATATVEILVDVAEVMVVDEYSQTNDTASPVFFTPQPVRTDLQLVEIVADPAYDCTTAVLFGVTLVGCNNPIQPGDTLDLSVVYLAAEQPTELVNTALVSADSTSEFSDTVTTIIGELPSLVLTPETLELTASVDTPETLTEAITVEAYDNQDQSMALPEDMTLTAVDDDTQAAPTWLSIDGTNDGLTIDTTGLAAGIYSATVTAAAPSFNEDTMTVTLDVQDIPTETSGSALIQITPNTGLGASTFGNNSFQFNNLAGSGSNITSVSIDLSTGLLPDMVFDPVGAGGDETSNCVTANSGAATTGVTIPANDGGDANDPDCSTPFSQARNGGFDVMTLEFTDFNPGESFIFKTDIDPNSIQGVPGAGNAGAVSGFELIGATVTVTFEDGTVVTSLFDQGSLGGSQALAAAAAPAAPSIQAVGVPVTPATVGDLNQMITVTGTPGDDVTLLVMDTRLFIASGEAPFDVSAVELPFYANEALGKALYTATIGQNGTVDVPITLLTTDGSVDTPDGGLNTIIAAADGAGDQTSQTSNVLVLKYDLSASNTPPIMLLSGDNTVTAGETATVNIQVTDGEFVTLAATVTDQNAVAVPNVIFTNPGDNTGSLSITTTLDDGQDTFTVEVTADDGTNAPVIQTFVITVNPVTDTNPGALITILDGVNGYNDKSTFGSGAFYVENTGDVNITAVDFNVSSAYMPDVVFDPLGTGGDTASKCFNADSNEVLVGLTTPEGGGKSINNPACTVPFYDPNGLEEPNDTDANTGYFGMKLDFNDFNPTETFTFSVDMDPTSIKGDNTAGGSGGISGMEMIAGTVTVTFADGNMITTTIWLDGSQSDAGGRAVVALNAPTPAPVINMVGLNTPATTNIASQTIQITGPANAPYTLLQVDARLHIDSGSANGPWPNGYGLEPFEANESINKVIFNGTLDANGVANVPVTLLQSPTPYGNGPVGGLNHFIAVFDGNNGQTSGASNVIVVEFDPTGGEENEAPIVTNPGPQTTDAGDGANLTITASAPELDQSVTFEATGLPPGLTINPATGVISGMAQAGGGSGAFLEQNGLVIIETESAENLPGQWATSANATSPNINDPGSATGGDFIVWEGSQSFGTPGLAQITYQVEITNPGVYQFVWRNQVGNGTNTTEHNDTWLKIEADAFYAQSGGSILCPKGFNASENDCVGGSPNGSGSGGWFKVYAGGANNWSWSTKTSDNDAHNIFARFDAPGVYNILVSKRSSSHVIDRMVLSQSGVNGQGLNLPESPRSTGGGNTIYDVTVTATDNGVPALATAVDFTWTITQPDVPNVAPNAVISVNGSTTVTSDTAVTFNLSGANSSDSDGTVNGYAWSNGANGPATSVIVQPGASQQITLTVTDNDGATDNATVTLSVIEPGAGPGIGSLVLIDAGTDQDLFALSDGQQLDINSLPATLAVRADVVEGDQIDSVSFSLTGAKIHSQNEGVEPYALFGDNGGNYAGEAFGVGNYTLTATPDIGTALTINFSIVDGVPVDQPPTAVITVTGPTTLTSDTAVTFDLSGATSTDPDGTVVGYAWSTGATTQDTSVIVQPGASTTVNLTVTDNDGLNSAPVNVTLTVEEPAPQPPTAIITVDGPTTVADNAPVTFNLSGATSTDPDGTVAGYTWSTGATTQDTSVIVQPGASTVVTLTVTDNDGLNSAPVNVTLTVTDTTTDTPPVITVIGPQTVNLTVGDSYTDQGATASDVEDGDLTGSIQTSGLPINTGVAGSTIVTYSVTDSDQNTVQATRTVNVNEPTVGPAVTAFIVVDAASNTELFAIQNGQQFNVGDLPASMSIRALVTDEEGDVQSVVFNLTGANTHNQTESGAPYALFGDISGDYDGESFGVGTYNLTATPFSNNGGSGIAGAALSITFMVVDGGTLPTNEDPNAAISITSNNGNATVISNDPVTFTLSGAGSTDGDGTIVSYAWNNGDTGPTTSVTVQPGTATTVTLAVNDDDGATDTDSVLLAVNEDVVTNPACAAVGTQVQAETGTLAGNFTVGNDAAASGGQFVHVPNAGILNGNPNNGNTVTYCFNVPQSGNYQIQGLVWPTSSGNTFWVQVLGQNYLWDLPSQNNTYSLDTVNNRNAGGADVTLTLPAGEVTVIVRLREDGARLDTIGLVPAGGAGNSINPLNTTPAFDAPAIPRTSPFSR